MLRRRSFTLIELVAVITIAALAVGISSTAMRRSSGAENALPKKYRIFTLRSCGNVQTVIGL